MTPEDVEMTPKTAQTILRDAVGNQHGIGWRDLEEIADLIESLAKDATRYRWLKEYGGWPKPNDASIDAAIASQAPHPSRES